MMLTNRWYELCSVEYMADIWYLAYSPHPVVVGQSRGKHFNSHQHRYTGSLQGVVKTGDLWGTVSARVTYQALTITFQVEFEVFLEA